MKANSDVTDALRRTVSLMQAELERSVLTTQMLDSSTATIRSTSLQHDTLNSVMSTSKQLITALEKSDWLDRILIISGFIFFLLVVLFILKQRIVDRGLRIAFWWTKFLPNFSSDEQLLRSAIKSVVEEPSSLSATAVSVATSLVSLVASSNTVATVAAMSNMPDPSSTPAGSTEFSEIGNTQNPSPFPHGAEVVSEARHQNPSSLLGHVEL